MRSPAIVFGPSGSSMKKIFRAAIDGGGTATMRSNVQVPQIGDEILMCRNLSAPSSGGAVKSMSKGMMMRTDGALYRGLRSRKIYWTNFWPVAIGRTLTTKDGLADELNFTLSERILNTELDFDDAQGRWTSPPPRCREFGSAAQ